MTAQNVGNVMALTPIIYIVLPMLVKSLWYLNKFAISRTRGHRTQEKIFTKSPKCTVLDVNNVSPVSPSGE